MMKPPLHCETFAKEIYACYIIICQNNLPILVGKTFAKEDERPHVHGDTEGISLGLAMLSSVGKVDWKTI